MCLRVCLLKHLAVVDWMYFSHLKNSWAALTWRLLVLIYNNHFPPAPFRGIVEETPNTTEHGRPSVMLEKYAAATKMQPQSSGSLRSNAGIEKGKEIAARLNIHRIHSQLRGLDSTGQLWWNIAPFDPLCHYFKWFTVLLYDLQPLC